MKKAILCTFALSLFALPMTLHANPPAKADAAKATMVKPLSAMKSTIASPSKAPATGTKAEAAEASEKALDEKAGTTKKWAKDAGKAEMKKSMGQK